MKRVLNFLLIAITSAAVAFLVSAVTNYDGGSETAPMQLSQTSEGSEPITKAEEAGDIPTVSRNLMPSVVGISSSVGNRSLFNPSEGELWSMGSGISVSEQGHILTNQHVVADAKKIYITAHSGETFTASYVWGDSGLDIAVVKLDHGAVPPAPLGDSSSVTVGESVIAIGNPLSLQFQRTVTAGIISATNRSIALSENGKTHYMEDLIQTDASINPGNSGGPLINLRGEVIGINTIKVSSAEGMGFAIPINVCRPVIERIISEGSFITPYLGLYAYDREVAAYVTGSFQSEKGIYVAEVDPSGPAQRAGVKVGDIITHVDNNEVHTMLNLRERLFYHKAGEKVLLTVSRSGQDMTFEITLARQ